MAIILIVYAIIGILALYLITGPNKPPPPYIITLT